MTESPFGYLFSLSTKEILYSIWEKNNIEKIVFVKKKNKSYPGNKNILAKKSFIENTSSDF
jgi:hypothetical protein